MFEKQLLKHTELLQLMHTKQTLTLQTTDSSRSYYILFASYSVSPPKFPSHPFQLVLMHTPAVPLLPYFCFRSISSFFDYFLPPHSNSCASIFVLLSVPLSVLLSLPVLRSPGSLNPRCPPCALIFLCLPCLSLPAGFIPLPSHLLAVL